MLILAPSELDNRTGGLTAGQPSNRRLDAAVAIRNASTSPWLCRPRAVREVFNTESIFSLITNSSSLWAETS